MADQVRGLVDNEEFSVFVNDVQEVVKQRALMNRKRGFLSSGVCGLLCPCLRKKWDFWLPVLLMLAFAITRWPGLLPDNFSAAYALAFCAGVYFPRRTAWWLTLSTLMASDVAINLYYYFARGIDAFKWTQLLNYAAFALLIWLGARFSRKAALWKLVGGGMLGGILFYLLTNTASWFFNPFHNPEYTKTFAGWLIALTKGTAGYPQTWEFLFRT